LHISKDFKSCYKKFEGNMKTKNKELK